MIWIKIACKRCHKYIPKSHITKDHIMPRHGFGYTSINSSRENIQWICMPCHKKKSVIEDWVKNKFIGGNGRAQKSLYLMFESY